MIRWYHSFARNEAFNFCENNGVIGYSRKLFLVINERSAIYPLQTMSNHTLIIVNTLSSHIQGCICVEHAFVTAIRLLKRIAVLSTRKLPNN